MTFEKFPESPVFGEFAYLKDNEDQKTLHVFGSDMKWHELRQETFTLCPYEFNSLIRDPDGTLPYEGPLTLDIATKFVCRIPDHTLFVATISGLKGLYYIADNSNWIELSELTELK